MEVSSILLDCPGGSVGKEYACDSEKPGFDPWVGKIPLKDMATHSSVLAWEILRTEESGSLHPWGHKSQTQLSN